MKNMNNGSYVKKTGILGGTFNPIHIGHLILAQNALEYCGLDKVLFIPSGCSYLKDPETIEDTAHRINMTALAIKDNERFELSTIETDRPGNSYTYETLDILCSENPDIRYHYIVGADTLLSMDTWNKPELIFDKCTVVCARRNGHTDSELAKKAKSLKTKYGADIILMDSWEIPISSTDVRQKLTKGTSCRYYLPDDIIRYIKENGLYGNNSNR